MDGLSAVVDTVPGPVNGRTDAFGVQSESPLVLADWAVRWVTDQLRGLITAEKEDPLTLDKYVCKHQPVPHASLPQFMKKVWDPVRFQAMRAIPSVRAALEARVKCKDNELETPNRIEVVKVKKAEGVFINVQPMDPMSVRKRSAHNPAPWVQEAKGLKSFTGMRVRQAGEKPPKFGGNHQSLFGAAAARADSQIFAVHPYRRISGFLERLMGDDQEWADRAREVMQEIRTIIHNTRSADAAEILRTTYTAKSAVQEGHVPPNDGFRFEMCRRMGVPNPSSRPTLEVQYRLKKENGTCDFEAEMAERCPMPGCARAEGYLHQCAHLSYCGDRLIREDDKRRMTGLHYHVERRLLKIAQEATGREALKEIRGVYNEEGNYSMDIIIPREGAKPIYVDVTTADPHAKCGLSQINRRTDNGDRHFPSKPVGSDHQDEAAGARAAGRKWREINEPIPPHRLMGGRMAPGTATERVKSIKNRNQVVFQDFVVLATGRLGNGARGLLRLLARIRRKRLGVARSRSVEAQVRIWARVIAKGVSMLSACRTIQFNLKLRNMSGLREARVVQGAGPAGAVAPEAAQAAAQAYVVQAANPAGVLPAEGVGGAGDEVDGLDPDHAGLIHPPALAVGAPDVQNLHGEAAQLAAPMA